MHTFPPVMHQIRNYMHHWRRRCSFNVRKTTWDEKLERLNICNSCELLDKESQRCYACGCFVYKKAEHWDEICPVNNWPTFSLQEKLTMRLFENELQNSLVGLTAVFTDHKVNHSAYDVTMSCCDPTADIFIITNKEAIDEHLDETDNLGLVFAPNLYREEIGTRPFTFYFQPSFHFQVDNFFESNTVYFGNLDTEKDSHGNPGCSHPVFAAIKFALYLGITKLDLDIHDYCVNGNGADTVLNLRLGDLIERIERLENFEVTELNSSSPFNRIPCGSSITHTATTVAHVDDDE